MMDLDLNLPCYMDGSSCGYFLMMDDMTLEYGNAMKSQWMAENMEGSKDDF